MGFVIVAMLFAAYGFAYFGIVLLGMVIFLILAIVFRKKKKPCIVFTVLTVGCFMPLADVGCIALMSILGERRYLLFAFLAAVLFAALAFFNRKKKKLCIAFTAAAALIIMPIASIGCFELMDFLGEKRYRLFALFAAVLFAALIFFNRKKKKLCIAFTAAALPIIMPVTTTIPIMIMHFIWDMI